MANPHIDATRRWWGITRIAGLLGTVTVCLALAACGPGGGTNAQQTGIDGITPTFSGPYADDFSTEYEQAPTDLARDILSDGIITEAEIQELYADLNRCLQPYGLQSDYSPDGGETITKFRGSLSDEEESEVWKNCQSRTGAMRIAGLYSRTRNNSSNQDDGALDRDIYRCFVKHDLLPEPIGEDEYVRSFTVGTGATQDELTQAMQRWNAFFADYMEFLPDGNPNPDYDKSGARQFWDCNTDPEHQ